MSSKINTIGGDYEPSPFLFGPRISLGYGAQFLIIGILLPYFPVWLASIGLTSKEIGIVLFMPFVIRVLTSGYVTNFADTQNDRSNVLSGLFVCAAVSALLFLLSTSFWTVLIVTVIFNFFFNPILPVMDAVALAGVRRFNADYGRMRIWGSIVFIIANMGGGYLLSGYEPQILLYVFIASTIAASIASFAMPRIGRKQKQANQKNEKYKSNEFWKNKNFVLILLASGLVQASHAMLYGFGSIYWQDIGFSGEFIGVLWAVGVIAEIILFQFASKLLKHISPFTLLIISALGAIIRWSLFPFVESESAVFILQTLHGISFGAMHIATMYYIMNSVPEQRIGSAQGVSFVLSGVAMGAMLLASGLIYDGLGVYAFMTMAIIAALGLLSLFFAKRYPMPKFKGND